MGSMVCDPMCLMSEGHLESKKERRVGVGVSVTAAAMLLLLPGCGGLVRESSWEVFVVEESTLGSGGRSIVVWWRGMVWVSVAEESLEERLASWLCVRSGGALRDVCDMDSRVYAASPAVSS